MVYWKVQPAEAITLLGPRCRNTVPLDWKPGDLGISAQFILIGYRGPSTTGLVIWISYRAEPGSRLNWIGDFDQAIAGLTIFSDPGSARMGPAVLVKQQMDDDLDHLKG